MGFSKRAKRHYRSIVYISCIAFTLLSGTVAFAQALVNKPVFLKNGVIATTDNIDEWLAGHNPAQLKLPMQVLVQLNRLPGADKKAILKQSGIVLDQYIPDNAYIAILYRHPDREELVNAGIRYIADVPADWKMSDELKAFIPVAPNEIEITALFTDGLEEKAVTAFIESSGALLISNRLSSMGYCSVRLPSENIYAFARWYGVSYVGKYIADVPLNIESKALDRMQIAASPVSFGGYGLKGKGIAIGVGDNTSGIFHVDLMDRIINYNPAGYTNHGVHINGIAGGAGIVNPKGEGMAPEATLTNHYFSDVLDVTPEIAQLHNVIITNNSYSASQGSCTYSGTYDALSAGLDKLCNANNTVFQVFAAANDGLFDCPPFPKGFATIAGGYQPAKNNIVVASTDKLYVNADNSSRGPVKDGRLKPEISAVGVNVNSTTKNDEYLVASGTSMAAPQVAGAAALLAERLKQINGTVRPRADLLKTLLINGATDIGIPGPDYRFGFGFLNVERSLIMLDSNRYVTNIVTHGQQTPHAINVPANTAQLKILLCWHDIPASPLAAKQLVNDIDLEVAEPGGTTHRPLVLDPTPANINNPAVEKEDRLNNCEQVVIDNPPAGTYTINVKGFNIPSGTQEYVLAYDFLPKGIFIKYPITAAQVKANDSMYIYWDATTGNGNFTLEYSLNDGNSWNTIDNNVPADQLYYKWQVPDNINSGRCRMRLTRTIEQSVSGLFVINTQPDVQLSATQCPGYIQVNWNAVGGAVAYEVLKKSGPVLAVVDTVTTTGYAYSGLSLDSTYYVAVRPILDGLRGYRSIAIRRRPLDGDCSGNISDGDLMVEKITAPLPGRKLTATELTANETLVVRLRNLDDMPCNKYKISYSINGGAWDTTVFTAAIPANSVKTVNIPGFDFAAEGDYLIRLAIENLDMVDPVKNNDSTAYALSQLPNLPVSLDFTDGFESLSDLSSIKDTAGFGTGRRWDFQKTTDTGRIRSFVLSDVVINGQRSVTLDAYKNCIGNFNLLTGTFNMTAYHAAADEIRLEFDYVVHGIPKTAPGNEVLIKGADTKNSYTAYTYKMDRANIGKVNNSGSISLSDIMLNAGDDFSTSTQLQFGQNDTSLVGGRYIGNGITLDDIRLYTVQNDVQLLSVVSPDKLACGITSPVPLTVRIRNGVNQAQDNVAVHFRLDTNAVVTEVISSIAGKQTIDFTFSKMLDITASGSHILNIWITAAGDSYAKNDSILNYGIRNQPLVNSYPYFEDFEANDGNWFAGGLNSSWAYGKPAAQKISNAASGQNAWVTNLTGNYHDNELSYLFSPCFDLSGLNNPTLSFKLALAIENCEALLCDAAFVDYTTDGENWERVGAYGMGTNWYNDSNYKAWTLEDKTAWHQAEIPLPKDKANVQLRYGLLTDEGSTREGIGVDDIRIYDQKLYLPDNEIISISPNPTEDGIINIEWAAHSGTEMKMMMTDIMGKEVFHTAATAQEGYNKTTIQAPLFSTGMYFMRIIIGEKQHKRKIIFRRH